ncbi:MAG: trimeric intracellular cation channel family protein [Propionibacteriaceae bacterium]
MLTDYFPAVVTATDLAGVLGNALLGGMAARRARLDVVGFIIVAIVSGLGGGMIRDALLGSGPAAVLLNPWYLPVAVGGVLVAYIFPVRGRWPLRLLAVIDAVALGCWSAVGVQKGIAVGLPWVPVLLLGVITAVGGGMVRDLLLQRRPAVLGGNTLYASAAFLASVVALCLTVLGHHVIAMGASILVGAVVTLAARRYRWMLPAAKEH